MGMSRLVDVIKLLGEFDHATDMAEKLWKAWELVDKHGGYLVNQTELTEQYKKDWLHAVKRSDHYKDTASTLMERIEELENTIKAHDHSKSLNATVAGENMNLKIENHRYKQALEFYADESNYDNLCSPNIQDDDAG